jgi:integrase
VKNKSECFELKIKKTIKFKNMSVKGTSTTSDYLDFEKIMFKSKNMLENDKTRIYGLYVIIAINTGLRIGDIRKLTFDDLRKDKLTITEGKTKKTKTIAINENIKELLNKYGKGKTGSPFITQKKGVLSVQHLNVQLKKLIKEKGLRISSHSMRKTFGRRVYFQNNESEKALMYLMDLFNHSSMAITKKYLGIRQEELDNIYLNL